MGRLVRLLDEARLYRAPIERLADQVAAYFVPVVVFLALATFLFWTWAGSFEQGLLNSLAVLLIACPCALGIATPLAIWAALGRAAQAGILIRDSLTLEKLAHIRHIFFDKTGTLTTGQSALAEIATAEAEQAEQIIPVEWEQYYSPRLQASFDQFILRLAASLEVHSEHPLGRSIAAAAAARHLSPLPVDNFQAIPGQGIRGRIAGETVFIGSWRLVEQQGLRLGPALQAERGRLEQAGLTVIHIGWRGRVRALLGLAEMIRPEAAAVLAELAAGRCTTQALTGDSAASGAALGRYLGVAVRSQLLPHEKVSAVEAAEKKGPTAMVGDGLNDAPALARASVGIALGCGADVTREAADVSLLGSDLRQISWVLGLARRSYRIIGWNLAWAFVYNLAGIALAMAGYLHPVLAAAAMVLSSGLVVSNSLRIFKVKECI